MFLFILRRWFIEYCKRPRLTVLRENGRIFNMPYHVSTPYVGQYVYRQIIHITVRNINITSYCPRLCQHRIKKKSYSIILIFREVSSIKHNYTHLKIPIYNISNMYFDRRYRIIINTIDRFFDINNPIQSFTILA